MKSASQQSTGGDCVAYGFTMLPSYYEAIRPLSDGDRLAMYDAIMDYAFSSKAPENLSPILNGYFTLLRPNIDSSIKHYSASVENGKKGGRPPKEKPSDNPAKTQDEPVKNRDKDMERDMERDMECEREKAGKPSRTNFIPPTVEEVQSYCKERKNSVDPERFVDYYAARGWAAGKSKLKDWRAAVRTWEKRDREEKKTNDPVHNSGCNKNSDWDNLPGVVSL